MPATIVVAGAGQAGASTAAALREFGFPGRIVLVGDEPYLPYQRPPLSKGHLNGTNAQESLWLHPSGFYAHHEIDLMLDDSVRRIDRNNARVELASGTVLDYEHLVLALGGRNRALPLTGADLDGVVGLRSLDEADDIRDRLGRARNLVVVGGGFIGLEVAATAVKLGVDAVVIEVSDQLMGRVVSPEMGRILLDAHRARGLRVALGTSVRAMSGVAGRVNAVVTSDGHELPADLVLVGVGAIPNTEIAEGAGLRVDNGIVVDEYLATEDTRISAVGDCTVCPNPFASGRNVRLESVHNATAQARFLAARLVGRAEPYVSVPWFWSNQGDLKLQIAGLRGPSDHNVFRGDPASGRFSVFCFEGGVLRCVESLNRPGDHMAARKLIAAGVALTPDQAGDLTVDLRTHLAEATVEPVLTDDRAPARG
jgi:3-phenylpropionate/trans-cinnamate dioxygenase ferredoxin reductase subunit